MRYAARWMTGVEKGRVAVARADFLAAQGAPLQSSHDFKRKGDYTSGTKLYGFIREYMARVGAPLNYLVRLRNEPLFCTLLRPIF
jgi:hypothetical protein